MPDRRRARSGRTAASAGAAATKACAGCGREMVRRKAWARSWDEVRWCSDACRSRGRRAVDVDAESLLVEAVHGSARAVDPETLVLALGSRHHGLAHADLREALRSAARRLAAGGEVEVVVEGRVVEPSRVSGPLAVRRTASSR